MAPEELLRLDSREAVYQLAQLELDRQGLPLDAHWYRISKPVVINETLTQVTLYLDKAKAPVEHWSTSTFFTIQYHRINIGAFSSNKEISVEYPTTTNRVMRTHLQRYQIPVSDEDFEERNAMGPGTIDYSAKLDSLRWVGSVTLKSKKLVRDLSEILHRRQVVTNYSPAMSSVNMKKDIIDHLNDINRSTLYVPMNPGNIQICCPIQLDFQDKNNTKILVKAITGDYEGEEYVYYNRRTFIASDRVPIVLKFRNYTTAVDLLSDLSAKLGCTIVDTDIHDIPITEPKHQRPLEFVINFRDTSMAYFGYVKVKLHA